MEAPVEIIKLYLLNPEPLIRRGQETLAITRRHALELFVYLADNGSHEYEREKLEIFLFGDDSKSGKLKHAASQLRSFIGEEFIPREIAADRKLSFNPELIQVDAHKFKDKVTRLLKPTYQHESARFEKEALETLKIYNSPFLSNFEFNSTDLQSWHDERQKDLAQLRNSLLEQLVQFYIRHDELTEAQKYANIWYEDIKEGFVHLQYLIWLKAKQHQNEMVNKYLTELTGYEEANQVFFGPTPAEWIQIIRKQKDISPVLLGLSIDIDNKPEIFALSNIIREADIKRLSNLLFNATQPNIIALTGLPGIGKTIFIQQVLDGSMASKSKYDVAYVELSQESDFESLLNEVLIQLDMGALTDSVYMLKQKRFKQKIQERSCLIIIDEGNSQKLVSSEFVQTLVNLFEGSRLLFVARQFPDENYYTFELNGFDGDMVSQFLNEQIFELEAIKPSVFNRLAEITGGLPLILKLIVGFLQEQRFTLEDFAHSAKDIDNQAWTLENAPTRYQKILDLFWKYLNSDEQHLLYALSMFDFRRGCSEHDFLIVAATAFDIPKQDLKPKLEILSRICILDIQRVSESYRYRLHPIIYDYIQSQKAFLDAELVLAIQETFIHHMMDYAQAHTDDFLKLDREKFNLIHMFELAFSKTISPQLQFEATTLLDKLYDYFDRRGFSSLAEQLLDKALSIEDLSPLNEIRLLCRAGQVIFKQTRLDDAKQKLDRAWQLSQNSNISVMESVIMRDLGRVYLEKGKLELAKECFKRGEEAAINHNQHIIQAHIIANLGVVHAKNGQADEAQIAFETAVSLLNPDSDTHESYEYHDVFQFSLNHLAILKLNKKDYLQAEKTFQHSLSIAKVLNNPERIARVYMNLGVTNYNKSDFNAALKYFEQASLIAENIQHSQLIVWLTMNKGILKVIKREYGLAQEMLDNAQKRAKVLGIDELLPYIFIWQGLFHLAQMQTKQARAYFTKVFNQPVLDSFALALTVYGLVLEIFYEHSLFIEEDKEKVKEISLKELTTLPIPKDKLLGIPKESFENAETYIHIALKALEKSRDYQLTEIAWTWLTTK